MIQNKHELLQAKISLKGLQTLLHEIATNTERFAEVPAEQLAATKEQVKNDLKEFEQALEYYEKWNTGWRKYVPQKASSLWLFASGTWFILYLIQLLVIKSKESSYYFIVANQWLLAGCIMGIIEQKRK